MTRRPLGIWVITFLQLLLAAGLLASSFTGIDLFSHLPGQRLEERSRALYLAWVVVTLVAALLLWRLSRRGWVLTMLLTGLSLAGNLWLWWIGEPNHLRMGMQAVVAFYLNSTAVRQLFLRRSPISRLTVRDADDA